MPQRFRLSNWYSVTKGDTYEQRVKWFRPQLHATRAIVRRRVIAAHFNGRIPWEAPDYLFTRRVTK